MDIFNSTLDTPDESDLERGDVRQQRQCFDEYHLEGDYVDFSVELTEEDPF